MGTDVHADGENVVSKGEEGRTDQHAAEERVDPNVQSWTSKGKERLPPNFRLGGGFLNEEDEEDDNDVNDGVESVGHPASQTSPSTASSHRAESNSTTVKSKPWSTESEPIFTPEQPSPLGDNADNRRTTASPTVESRAAGQNCTSTASIMRLEHEVTEIQRTNEGRPLTNSTHIADISNQTTFLPEIPEEKRERQAQSGSWFTNEKRHDPLRDAKEEIKRATFSSTWSGEKKMHSSTNPLPLGRGGEVRLPTSPLRSSSLRHQNLSDEHSGSLERTSTNESQDATHESSLATPAALGHPSEETERLVESFISLAWACDCRRTLRTLLRSSLTQRFVSAAFGDLGVAEPLTLYKKAHLDQGRESGNPKPRVVVLCNGYRCL